jgi:cyanate permease
MSAMLGLWGAYMPFATAAALLCGPAWMAWAGWQAWYGLLGALSLVMGLWLAAALPADPRHHLPAARDWRKRVSETLRAPGPWRVALSFGVYSAQWLAVIGFLPSIYLAAGLPAGSTAVGTALAAAVNMVGNLMSGRLLQQGVPPSRLLAVGFAAMALGAMLAFSDLLGHGTAGAFARYAAVLCFSMVGGIIPGTLFSLAVRLAPSERTVSTTVGWMQQWSAFGQFAGPPLVAWLAARVGGWQWSWLVTGGCAACGLALAASIARRGSARPL